MTEVEIREYLQNYRDRKTIADYKAQNGGKMTGTWCASRQSRIVCGYCRTDSGIFFGCTISRENPCGKSQRSISIARILLPSAGTKQ